MAKERNSCLEDVSCITNSYLLRNRSLAASNNLRNVNDIFNREGDKLDEMLDGPIKTRSGFTITDSPWLVKKYFHLIVLMEELILKKCMCRQY